MLDIYLFIDCNRREYRQFGLQQLLYFLKIKFEVDELRLFLTGRRHEEIL